MMTANEAANKEQADRVHKQALSVFNKWLLSDAEGITPEAEEAIAVLAKYKRVLK